MNNKVNSIHIEQHSDGARAWLSVWVFRGPNNEHCHSYRKLSRASLLRCYRAQLKMLGLWRAK